jgi:hypothetical protein
MAPAGRVRAAAFSPDGKTLATAVGTPAQGQSTVCLWDVAPGRELRRWPALQPGCVAFAPDGKTLAGVESWGLPGQGRALHFWDLGTGKEACFALGQQTPMSSVAFSPDGRTLAWGNLDGAVCLWEVAAGRVRRRLAGHQSAVYSLAFSPGGRTLATGSYDATALVWDVTGADPTEGRRPRALSPRRLQELWADLAGPDAPRAYRAIGALAARPRQTVPFFEERLRPVSEPDPSHVARLVADLDSPDFAVRERAVEGLSALGDAAGPALQKTLAGGPGPQVRRRLGPLVQSYEGPVAVPEALRALRALEVLEQVGTPEARRLLEALAGGRPRPG